MPELRLHDTAPDWKEDKAFGRDSGRKKEIRIVKDEAGNFGSFVEKVATAPFSVRRLEREFNILQKLRATGVTPLPQSFIRSPDGKQARLMMEQVPGMSFEQRTGNDQDIQLEQFPGVVAAALEATTAINKQGVCIVDINAGTFVVDSTRVSVVDFELARETKELLDAHVRNELRSTYESADIGIALAIKLGNFHLTSDNIRSSERFRTANTVIQHFFKNHIQTFDYSSLTAEEQIIFEERKKNLLPYIEQQVETETDDTKRDAQGRYLLSQGLLDIILPHLLVESGITMTDHALQQLQKCLSPIISERL